jgi:DNA-directed RNA polymerase omega subunit
MQMNKFEFVILAGARAKQLQAGCTPKVEGSDKPARRAMQEIREHKVERVPDEKKMLISLGVTGGICAYKSV